MGIFRRVLRPAYDDVVRDQIAATAATGQRATLPAVLAGPDAWSIGGS